MHKIKLVLIGLTSMVVGQAASADTGIDSIRLLAKAVQPTVDFYERAFGGREVRRLHPPSGDEVFLDFSAAGTAPAAAAPTTLIVMQAPADPPSGDTAHLILRVSDIDAAFQAAKAAGGSPLGEPMAIPGGMMIAEIADPAGNKVQLLQLAKH